MNRVQVAQKRLPQRKPYPARDFGHENVLFHHHNAPAHTSAVTTTKLVELDYELLYSVFSGFGSQKKWYYRERIRKVAQPLGKVYLSSGDSSNRPPTCYENDSKGRKMSTTWNSWSQHWKSFNGLEFFAHNIPKMTFFGIRLRLVMKNRFMTVILNANEIFPANYPPQYQNEIFTTTILDHICQKQVKITTCSDQCKKLFKTTSSGTTKKLKNGLEELIPSKNKPSFLSIESRNC